MEKGTRSSTPKDKLVQLLKTPEKEKKKRNTPRKQKTTQNEQEHFNNKVGKSGSTETSDKDKSLPGKSPDVNKGNSNTKDTLNKSNIEEELDYEDYETVTTPIDANKGSSGPVPQNQVPKGKEKVIRMIRILKS